MEEKPVGIETRWSRRARWYAGCASLALLLIAIGTLAFLPAVLPSAGARVADLIRSALGPNVVADLETASFRIQDAANQGLYSVTGNGARITFGSVTTLSPGPSPALLAPRAAGSITNAGNAVAAPPQIGWHAYGPQSGGEPVMARALLNLDPQRPYAGIALVRIDVSHLQLHMLPGFLEPSHDANVLKAIPKVGQVPAADLGRLVAAFNGGFKAVNGHYGMMVDGVTLLPPVPGIATIAIYRDGHVQMGAWGTDLRPGPDILAYRQNCPPLIENGVLDPQVSVDNRLIWGSTIGNQEITWRTAIGLSQDGRYLIYAVGNAADVSSMAQALQIAGAYNAMQLDINQHYAHFVTFQPDRKGTLTAVELLAQMENVPNLYLVAHSRDYFYLTTK